MLRYSFGLFLAILAQQAIGEVQLVQVDAKKGAREPLLVRTFIEQGQGSVWPGDKGGRYPQAVRGVREFIQAAQSGDDGKIARSFTAADGSRSKVRQSLEKGKESYSGFSRLSAAAHEWTLYWGNYRFVELVLDFGGNEMEMRPVVLCQADCGISTIDRASGTNAAAAIHAIGHRIRRYGYHEVSEDSKPAGFRVVYKQGETDDYPLRVWVDAEPMAEPLRLDQVDENTVDQRPAVAKLRSAVAGGGGQSSPDESVPADYWHYNPDGDGGDFIINTGRQVWQDWLNKANAIRVIGEIAGEGYKLLVLDVDADDPAPDGLQMIGVRMDEEGVSVRQDVGRLEMHFIRQTRDFYESLEQWAITEGLIARGSSTENNPED